MLANSRRYEGLVSEMFTWWQLLWNLWYGIEWAPMSPEMLLACLAVIYGRKMTHLIVNPLGVLYTFITWASRQLQSGTTRLVLQLVHANKKSKLRITGPFIEIIYRWSLDSPHKRPAMWKAFPCHEVIMLSSHSWYLLRHVPKQLFNKPVNINLFTTVELNYDNVFHRCCRKMCMRVFSIDKVLLRWFWVKPLTFGDRFNSINTVNTMVADALAPCVARTSAPMMLTIWKR